MNWMPSCSTRARISSLVGAEAAGECDVMNWVLLHSFVVVTVFARSRERGGRQRSFATQGNTLLQFGAPRRRNRDRTRTGWDAALPDRSRFPACRQSRNRPDLA